MIFLSNYQIISSIVIKLNSQWEHKLHLSITHSGNIIHQIHIAQRKGIVGRINQLHIWGDYECIHQMWYHRALCKKVTFKGWRHSYWIYRKLSQGRIRGGELTSYYKRKAGAQNFDGTVNDLSWTSFRCASSALGRDAHMHLGTLSDKVSWRRHI